MKYYLGVDGGASKTAALVTDETGKSLGTGIAGPSNHLRVGIETAARNIERAVNKAVVAADVATREIVWAYCGIAGEELRAGGWGPTIGDEGSGFAIARDGLAAVLRAYDGRGPATMIRERLHAEVHLEPADLPRAIYAQTTHADDIARYAKIVFDSADAGDAVARAILDRAANELALSVLAVARRLKLVDGAFPVAYVGGIFKAGEVLLAPLRAAIAAEAPKATLQPPLKTPVEGAAQMAIRAAESPRPERPRDITEISQVSS